MSSEANSEERLRRDDCVVLTLDLEDCPMAEIPLLELLDPDTATLVPEYQKIIRETVHQQLEECTWLANDDETRTACVTCASEAQSSPFERLLYSV
jgi:hypothetical protein